MKKHPGKLRFLGGFLSATLVFSLVTSALAFAGQVSFGGVNIAVFGQKQVDAAESFATVGGAQVPSSLTYTDEAGGGTVYLPMRLMAELLDTDIAWRADSKTVNFGVPDSAYNGNSIEVSLGDEGTNAVNDVDPIVDAPKIGVQAGPFTEIEPKPGMKDGMIFLEEADFSSPTGLFGQRYYADSQFKYAEITITNHGAPVCFVVAQADALRGGIKAQFSRVRLDTGESMTRAFAVGDSESELSRWLYLSVETIGSTKSITDITADVRMYK